MVEILSVTLKNFKAHSDRCFAFQPGTNAISGENGAGKTSILEAIAWVLFDHRGEYKVEDFIRNGESTAQATVSFISSRDQRTYDVQRSSRSGYTIYDPQLNEKLNLSRKGDEILPWLRENLGVAPGTDLSELFSSTIGVPQGTFTADFQLTPEKRKAIFDKVLKVEEYQKTFKDFINLEKYSKAQTDSLARDIAHCEEQLQEWDALVQLHTNLQQELELGKAELTLWQEKLEKLKVEQDRIGAQAAELQHLTNRVTQATSQVQSQEKELQRLATELEQAREAVEICTERRSAYQAVLQAEEMLKALEKQRDQQQQLEQQKQNLVQQSTDRTTQLATLNHQIERCNQAQTQFDRLQPQLAAQVELEKQLQHVQQQLQNLNSWRQTLTRDEKRLAQLQQRSQALKQELEQLQALETIDAQIAELEVQQQRYQQQLSRIAAAAQFDHDLRQILAQAQKRGTLHDQEIKTTATNLKALQAAAGIADQAITPIITALEHGFQLQAHLVADIQGILDDLSEQIVAERLEQAIQQTQIQLNGLRQQQARYLTLAAKQQEQTQIFAEIMEVKAVMQQAKTHLASEPEWQSQLTDLKQQLHALDDPGARSRFLQKEIEQQPALTQQKRQLQLAMSETQTQLQEFEQQLVEFADLPARITAQQEQRDLHRPDYNRYLEHQKAANRFKPLNEQFATAKEQLLSQQQQLAQLLTQQQTLAATLDPQEVAALQAAYQEANRETITRQAQLPEKLKRLEALEVQVAKLKTVQEKRDRTQTALKQQQKVDRFIKFARKAYKQAGPRITELYVQSIAREADKLFRELLNRPNVALEWTRDYEILVREGANERRFINLSGGEQMCAALAVRLALLKILADINIAFFDEPTTNMDRPRRIQLAEAISNIRSFRQLFVISHDDTFEQVTENVIFVTRETPS
ncbi:SMC family ATPase [filamentous cyanobacterium LEGE 11480]|uniref:Nuclease SbcCD subunit C n=1 Tax=Romeriopsis navalis LEGE 11480 TaxID=2777977 RepID=A0A928VUH5_9CYAN|nr:SMC family ATPase [Romeriopsis navalis]MBE9033296.1 SMC family ATPase [Romeriopsis navalis LEGE 11480]